MAIQLVDFTQLMQNEYPEPKWAVPNMIPEGLTLLVGRPKMGKSWLSLSLAIEVASGGRALGSIPVKQGKVVYFALEDNERRLQARCASLIDDRAIEEGQLLFSTTLDKFYKKEDKKSEENGLAQLETLIDDMGEELRVIFIDTLALITPRGKNENSYSDNYDHVNNIQKLAIEKSVAIVLVHHARKGQSEINALDDVMGSTGLTAGADCIMILKRTSGGNELILIGRDFGEQQLEVKHNSETGLWELVGDVNFTQMSEERKEIYNLLRKHGALTNGEICDFTNKKDSNISNLLRKMIANNNVIKVNGKYEAIIDEVGEADEVDEVDEVGKLIVPHRTSSLGSEENMALKPSDNKDSKNTSSTSSTSSVGDSLGKENINSPTSSTSSTSSVDDPSQLHLPVNREKYPDNEGYRRALMDKMTTEDMERIVQRNGDLNGHAHKPK